MSEQSENALYQYATVMQARTSGAGIEEGDIHIMDGKKEDGYRDRLFNDDKDIVVVAWDRLKLIELPGRMTSDQIMDFLNDNFEEYLGDVGDDDE